MNNKSLLMFKAAECCEDGEPTFKGQTLLITSFQGKRKYDIVHSEVCGCQSVS